MFLPLTSQEFRRGSDEAASHLPTDTDLLRRSSGRPLVPAVMLLLRDEASTEVEVEVEEDGSPEGSRPASRSRKHRAQKPVTGSDGCR